VPKQKPLESIDLNPAKIPDKFAIASTLSPKEKSKYTEDRLQELQTELFGLFKTCKKSCDTCPKRGCRDVVKDMAHYLSPYGESIYKRSFKKRSTVEEMYRVTYESINSLLMDVWHKEKKIYASFGAMLKFKMMHFLDGNINLFDIATKNYSVESMDALTGRFDQGGGGKDVVEFFSDVFYSPLHNEKKLLKENTIDVIIGIMESFQDRFSVMLGHKYAVAFYIKSLNAVNRFFQNKHNYETFQGDGRGRYYYLKLLDEIFAYLDKYKELN